MEALTLTDMLEEAGRELEAARAEICSPVDNRLIDAMAMLGAAICRLAREIEQSKEARQAYL